jgi:RNA-directed DNA polymerase
MGREKHKQKSCKAESINASHRGGQARISVEVIVMVMERRGLATKLETISQLAIGGTLNPTKPFGIAKHIVLEAYKAVKANQGSSGIDGETIDMFEKDLKNNLYRIWNRMSSGSYFPPSVKAVPIPKKSGGNRVLGIPTVADRIAQMVVKILLEPILEPIFDDDSYGYRPKRSAHQAIAITRQRCWKYDWVLEFDMKGLFDNISHSLLMKALEKHCKEPWIILYVQRWLITPLETTDGIQTVREKGTPQGGVISPLLANLFLHYTFDAWAKRSFLWFLFAAMQMMDYCTAKAKGRQSLY